MNTTSSNTVTEGHEEFSRKCPSRVFDVLLEQHKDILRKSGIMEKVADEMDHYSQFDPLHSDDLAQEHRWTDDDLGKTFVGFEVPDHRGAGIVFEVKVVAVFGSSAVSFEVLDAFELTFHGEGDYSVCHFGPFPEHTKFEIDALAPFTEEFMDRACAMLDYEETYDRFRLFLAIQDWALQPKKRFLQ